MNPVLPPPENGRDRVASIAFTAAVHLLLVAALFFGVQWKSRAPAPVEVELWNGAPAHRPPPEPRPEPKPEPAPVPKPEPKIEPPKPEPKPEPKPDIAVKEPKKKEPQKKPEPKKVEAKKPEPKKVEPKKPEPPRPSFDEELKREQQQLEQQKRLQQQAARAEAEARAQAEARAEQAAAARNRGLAAYVDKIRGKIRGNMVLPQAIQGNPEALVEVTQLPSGEVIAVRIKRSSGNANLDAAIERAIHKSSPLPKPEQPSLFQRVLEIKYRPFEE